MPLLARLPRARTHLLLPLVGVSLLAGAGLEAQPATGATTFSGTVVDGETGAPLPYATVAVDGSRRHAVSDQDGAFQLTLPPGEYRVTIRKMGFSESRQWWLASGGVVDVLAELTAQPLMLEGLRIVTDRFENRRLSRGVSSQVIEGERLARSSSPDLAHLVETHRPANLRRRTCGGRPLLERLCDRVYIDEVPRWREDLDLYAPQDVARVEIFADGRVRVYTVQFMEEAARRGYVPGLLR